MTLSLVTTPEEAFERYRSFLDNDQLVQANWHSESDGRDLACALGVLGSEVSSPRDCPAQIMPRWLAQMVPSFFDNQKKEDALSWGLAFYEQIARLNGTAPFSVIHDWQANVVGPYAIELAEKQGRDVSVHKALAEMQFAALTGKKVTADEWRPVLKSAFKDIYLWCHRANADAYANANAYADANANADAYAYANAQIGRAHV